MHDMDEDDLSEIDTTESEFDAMWAEATRVQTVVRYVAPQRTASMGPPVTVTGGWAAGETTEHSATRSAYARLARV
jgi:hypothetical protein